MDTKTTKTKWTLAFGANLAVVLMELVALSLSARGYGIGMLRFYTELSNVLALIACAVMACFTMRKIKTGTDIPAWARMLKYTAACCLTLTFLVVVFFLAPFDQGGWQHGYQQFLLRNQTIVTHLLGPIVTTFSYVFLEGDPLPTVRQTIWPILPTALYAVVTAVLNILRLMDGPYPFLRVYDQPVFVSVIWFVALLGVDYGIARLIRFWGGKNHW